MRGYSDPDIEPSSDALLDADRTSSSCAVQFFGGAALLLGGLALLFLFVWAMRGDHG